MRLSTTTAAVTIFLLLAQTFPSLAYSETALAVTTGDGLSLSLAGGGTVDSLTIDGSQLPRFQQDPTSTGFRIADPKVSDEFVAVLGELTAGEGVVTETATMKDMNIRLEATFRGFDRMIRVDATVADTSGMDRALVLSFTLPLNLAGWEWADDIGSVRKIAADTLYENTQSLGEAGRIATYPLVSVSDPLAGMGLALAVPMDEPRVFELQYWREGLSIVYRFGVSLLTERFPSRVSLTFYLYKNDFPEWSFRGALKKYYELFPQYFRKRVTKEGIWMPFTAISSVTNAEDFGFMFHEGDSDLRYDNAHGYYAFVYTEPWDYWLDMGAYESEPTPADVVAILARDLDSADEWRRLNARAVVTSGVLNSTQGLIFTVVNAPWISGSGWSALIPTNTDPSVLGNSSLPNKATVTWALDIMPAFERAELSGAVLDGVYLDSLQGYFTGTGNYRREHFRNVSFPLQWNLLSRELILVDLFTHYPLTEQVSEGMHGEGKLVMANAIGPLSTFFFHLVDVAGIEVDWLSGGRYSPDPEWVFNYRRSMMYQKPYLLLMNTNFRYLSQELVERYFRRCLHYAVFPSMFSADASTNPYWEDAALYERDRGLFRKYIPLIAAMSKAGWEPVTYARVDSSDMLVERYGPSNGTTFISICNPDGKPRRDFTLTVETEVLAIAQSTVRIIEMVEGLPVTGVRTGGELHISDTLASGDTKVYTLREETAVQRPNLTVALSKPALVSGDSIMISGLLSPSPGVSRLGVVYVRPDGTRIARQVNCSDSGAYTDTYRPEEPGRWAVIVAWEGSEELQPVRSGELSFTVEEPLLTTFVMIGVGAAVTVVLVFIAWRRTRKHPRC